MAKADAHHPYLRVGNAFAQLVACFELIGIDGNSVVESVKELMERIHYIHEEFDSPALIEEYIDGREIYAGVLGNSNPEVLPLIELDLSKLLPMVSRHSIQFPTILAFKLLFACYGDRVDV